MSPFAFLTNFIASRPSLRLRSINRRLDSLLATVSTNLYESVLQSTQYLPEGEIKKIQEKRVMRLVSRARRTIPFHRKYLKDINSIDDFYALRPSTKEEIRRAFDLGEFDNNRLAEWQIPRHTSGSTGIPLIFFMDKNMLPRRAAFYRRLLDWMGKTKKDVVVLLMPRQHPGLEKENVLVKWGGPTDVLKNLESVLSADRTRKIILQTSPYNLNRLAQIIEIEGLLVSFAAIISYTEELLPAARSYIEKVLQAPVFNYYACNEITAMAQECEIHEGFHVNSEAVMLEVLDESDRPVPAGTEGSVVVTALDNEVMPFIRYRLGDRGFFLTDPCPCGRTLPRVKITGRDVDSFIMPDGKVVYFPALFLPITKLVSKIRQYQVVRATPTKFIVKIVPANQWSEGDESFILERFAKYLGSDVSTSVELTEKIELLPGGKPYRFIDLAAGR